MNQQHKGDSLPETQNVSDDQSQHSILAHVKTLSAEQLNLYLHETKWLLNQLGYIMHDPQSPYPEVFEHSSRMVIQVDALREALKLERVRRQLAYLQTEISRCTRSGKEEALVTSLLDDKPDASDERNVSEVLVE